MQQVDDPPSLPVGTEVSAKYKGAFCEAKVSKVVRNIKVKVAYKLGLGLGIVSDDAIKAPHGQLRVGAVVEVRHPDRKDYVEAAITKIQDCSQYTVVFDDGDITTLRRTALCLKSGRHFNESETLDQLPLTHPEHFGNPVVGGRRGRRRGQLNDGSSDDDDESDAKEVVNEKEENIGKVVCVETESKKKDKEKWFPALVVAPTAQVSKQATVRIRVKDEYLVRSFKDGRYYTVPKKEATEFTREMAGKQDVPAVQAALEFLDSSILPAHWDRDSLFGLSNLSTDEEAEIDSDSSDDEPHEEKDRFVAQLYKYMDDRGTPLNKVPSIQSRDVDLYRLFRAVQKRGGYNRVTAKNQWKLIAMRLGFIPCTFSVMNLVKQAYKKFLQPYGDFNRKLGCSMLMTSRNSNRSKGRSLVRAISVASPKPPDTSKAEIASKLALENQKAAAAAAAAASSSSSSVTATATAAATAAASSAVSNIRQRIASRASQSAAEESGNTSESSVPVEPVKKQRKGSAAGKVKTLVEKYEEKTTPSTASAAATATATASSSTAAATTTTSSATAAATTGAAAATTAGAVSATASAGKDVEADVPLSKIKAAAATRKSTEKEPNAGSSNASSKAASETQPSRDVSPSATAAPSGTGTTTTAAAATTTASGGGTAKKEKHQQRKQVDKADEKRGKRKKDEVTVEKIDTGDFVVGIGDKLKVNYHEKKSPSSHGSTYEAKVIEISVQRGVPMYLVHYTGWNNRYDEWVPRERIAENLTKGSKQKTRTISTSSANSGGAPSSQAPTIGANTSGSGGNGSGSSAASGTAPPKDVSVKGASISEQQQQQQQSTGSGGSGVTKTPTSSAAISVSSKRGRGRSDSMPPRSTTPSSVASNSSRTKSPAASQSQAHPNKKRPTRTLPASSSNSNQSRRVSASISANVSDASMATESDTDSDEPVRRPKRLSAKEQQQQSSFGKTKAAAASAAAAAAATTPGGSGKKAAPRRRTSATEESDEDEEQQQQTHPTSKQQAQANQQQQQQTPPTTQRQRAVGNRAMSIGAGGAGKGRDYDLSEIRSELKGFQPQLLERKDAIKSEPSEVPAKQEPKTGSSTEQSSETDSYIDEDSQSSEKIEYRKQQSAGDKRGGATDKSKGSGATAGTATTTTTTTSSSSSSSIVEQQISNESKIKKESAESLSQLKHESAGSEDRKPIKVEPKEESGKLFHTGSDIKPTTAATGQRGSATNQQNVSGTAKCTSVIVEKPLIIKKTESAAAAAASTAAAATSSSAAAATSTLMPAKKLELLKKQQAAAGIAADGGGSKKFVEPVLHKETATLKVDLPAACSPSSSSSSSSSFCSGSNNSATTSSLSSSSATRSLPDMSKLEISSGVPSATGAGAGAATAGGSGKETKYSSSSANSNNIATGIKLLSSDVYEFKDTEPFEFEKRISPMAAISCTGTSVITATVASTAGTSSSTTGSSSSGSSTSNIAAPPTVAVSSAARKQALKASAMQHSIEHHQLPHVGHEPRNSAAIQITATIAAGKAKKRGSPLKEATLTLDKPKLQKLEPQLQQQQQQQAAAAATLPSPPVLASPNSVKTTSAAAAAVAKVNAATSAAAAAAATGGATTAGGALVTQLLPGHVNPFDVLRKSPSFNLNITALNEELAQTVQETTRALTDALQPPTTPVAPLTPATPPPAIPAGGVVGPIAIAATTPAIAVRVSPKLSTPPQAISMAKTAAQQQQQHIVGSPFMETRNVFELSTSNEGSGYSSGESNKDNKLEKLENVKILLAGAAGPFDLDAVKYEQKPSSIADKVLKAISQKKEEVEQSKTKGQPDNEKDEQQTSPTMIHQQQQQQQQQQPQQQQQQQQLQLPQQPTGNSNIIKSDASSTTSNMMDSLNLLIEPLKIQTSSAMPVGVLGDLCRRTSSSNSPETKSILDASLQAKNSELSETIQKLECAIQQRKTPVAGQSLASSTAGTPPVPTATGVTSFSDESMDSTDSEQRLVIEDTLTEEPSTLSELKSPLSETSSSLTGSVPVKLEPSAAGSKQLVGIQAPIALKPMQLMQSNMPGAATVIGFPIKEQLGAGTISASPDSPDLPTGVPILLPEIPVSVVVAMRHSPGTIIDTGFSPESPPPEANLMPAEEGGGLLLKTYTGRNSPLPAEIVVPVMDATKATASALPRPFLLQSSKEATLNVSPAAGSPLISDATHNEAAINLLCEETIPGSPAPTYTSKDELINVTVSNVTPAPAAPTTITVATTVIATPVPSSCNIPLTITPESPTEPTPRVVGAVPHVNQGPGTPSVSPNSSPESPASQDDSSEETGSSSLQSAVKKLDSSTLSGRRKRSRAQVIDANIQSPGQSNSGSTASELHAMGKRRRQQLNSMRKTTTTTVGSDTDDNSDNVVTTPRQSTRQQLLPQAQQQQQLQQQQQQQQQQQHQQLHQQQQQQLQQQQQQQPGVPNASGVRPCPYNFLVELDPSLSAEQCISILRKQIQDLRKAYNSIKGELAVIDRRRKKLRRREREKKQQHQMQGQQQNKVCI